MRLYNKYIIQSLFLPVIVITLALTGIIWLSQSLRFIDLIVSRGLDISTFLYLSSLLIPSLLIIILPIALFSAVLYTYNKLIADSELIVLRSAGLDRLSLALPAIIVAGVVTLFAYLISFYLFPASYREFKDTQVYVRDNYASVLLQEGVFSTPVKGLTVYVESRGENGMLGGILVHDSRNPERPATMMAQEGRLIQTDLGPRFELIKGSRQEVDRENGNLTVLEFDSYPFDLSVYTDVGEERWREPEERFLNELFFPTDASEKVKGKLTAEGHHRIIWPLYNIILTLLALTSLFSGQFNRRGQWKRILASTVFAVLLVVIYMGLKSAAASSLTMVFLLYLSALSFLGGCFYVLIYGKDMYDFSFMLPYVEKVKKILADKIPAIGNKG